MTGYGLIAVIPAYKQYKDAVDYYNYLVEHQEGIAAAVRMYNENKITDHNTNTKDELYLIDEDENTFVPGMLFSSMLRVGNLVGNLFRAQSSVVFTNNGSKDVILYEIRLECTVLDCPVVMFDFKKKDNQVDQRIWYNKVIKSGETLEFVFPGGITSLARDEEIVTKELRQMICEAAGKKLITSCPKLNIDGGIKYDLKFDWAYADQGITYKRDCYTFGRPGVLRYCGEAFYPEKVK